VSSSTDKLWKFKISIIISKVNYII